MLLSPENVRINDATHMHNSEQKVPGCAICRTNRDRKWWRVDHLLLLKEFGIA